MISARRTVGQAPGVYSLWLGAGRRRGCAFPTLLLALPLVRRLTGILVARA
ncbi:hypothetical protein [Xanthomonas sp. SI]|uniref:hypothetical protein n=1 Tax=Xanthomonas sp. SI TaxID=2724123 RepID=UPI00163A64C5|nr:hypothetical protein [Xanthomonas sp. SI]